MSFQLTKGESFPIQKKSGLLYAAAGWNEDNSSGHDFDADLLVFALDANGKMIDTHFLAWCNAPKYNGKLQNDGDGWKTADGSMRHTGDNLTGKGRGDDEGAYINIDTLPGNVKELAFWIVIYKAQERNQDFGMMSDVFVRVVDGGDPNGPELTRYDLKAEFAGTYAVQVGSQIWQADGSSKFTAVGVGSKAEIGDIIKQYS